MEKLHESVMPSEVLEFVNVSSGGVYLDGTFGEGGHSELLLKKGAGKVIALDRDAEALRLYQKGGAYREEGRLELHHARFSQLDTVITDPCWDGAVLDLGVSTRQLLKPERGFSFMALGPLDMRMDQTAGQSLSQRLDTIGAKELADVLYWNTGMRNSRAVARRICEKRDAGRISETKMLADLLGPRRGKTHPATETFLGLRMWVNDELREIEQGIPAILQRLKVGGRLVVISFHSTEDALVKRLFRKAAGLCTCQKKICDCPKVASVKILTKKPITPGSKELESNPRARSAKLRCVEKLAP